MFVRDPGARTSGRRSERVFWDSTCSRTRLVVATPALVEGFSLGPARRRRRSGAPLRVAVVFGPFFVVRVAFLRSRSNILSGGQILARLQRRAPTVFGRRPRASRGSRGGFRGATGGYLAYWLFSASAGGYSTALGAWVSSIASRSSVGNGKCSGAVWGCLRGSIKTGWRCLASSCQAPLG